MDLVEKYLKKKKKAKMKNFMPEEKKCPEGQKY
jgi:hypothetical protein